MEIYYFILFTTFLYLLYFLLKKISNFISINSRIQRSFAFENNNNVKETEIEKPEKFSSVLNQRKSRLDKIIACKNS